MDTQRTSGRPLNKSSSTIALVYPGIAGMGFDSFARIPGWDSHRLPLGLLYLGASLQRSAFEVILLDLRLLKSWEDFEDRLNDANADIVGVSVKSVDFDIACKAGEIARRMGKKVIAGGPHATIRPHDLMNSGSFDRVITGEGELSLVRMVQDLRQGRDTDPIVSGQRIANLDDLPFPDRGLYERYGIRLETESMIASRGCPFNCSFCQPTLRELFGKKIRYRSAENIVAEMEMLKSRFGVADFFFYDDTFTANKKLVEEFCTLVRSRMPGIEFAVNSRSNTFDEDICRWLAESGCSRISFGFESGSQRILDFLNKGITVEQSLKAAELCHQYGIPIHANILAGIPGETDEDYELTYRFLSRVGPEYMYYNTLSPFPGTGIHDWCCKRDLLLPPDSGEGYLISAFNERVKGIDYHRVRRWAPLLYQLLPERNRYCRPNLWESIKFKCRLLLKPGLLR
jgi:anaerobic magnesium-protoporphyrin IX monomethyl ester cyclase